MKTKKENLLNFKKESIIELSNSQSIKIVGGTDGLPGIITFPTRPITTSCE